MSLNTGTPIAKTDELERNTQNLATPTPRFARKFSTWNPPAHVQGAYPQNCMVEQPKNQISEMHFKVPYTFDISVMEDELQNRGMFLFWLSHGSNAMDQRSGDGRFSGRS